MQLFFYNSTNTKKGPWLYLGTSAKNRQKLADQYAWENEFSQGQLFHQVTEQMRQPFLNFIGDFGAHQKNILGWWSTSLSWKEGSSDLFLQVCYLKFIDDIVKKFPKDQLSIFIEDPWLYNQTKRLYGPYLAPDNVAWPLYLLRFRQVLLGVLKRSRWAFRTLKNFCLQKKYWGSNPFPASQKGVGLYSLAQSRCLTSGHDWIDPYLGPLNEILAQEKDLRVFRFTPPGNNGFEQEIGRRKYYFWPMILNFSLKNFFISLRAHWRPTKGSPKDIQGLSIDQLLLREWWSDIGYATWCQARFTYECTDLMLKSGRVKLLIFPYENQPWEKLTVIAAKKNKVAVLGYQHATVPKFQLSYFLGANESSLMPLPNFILTCGLYQKDILEAGGTPSSRLVLGGSLRYSDLLKKSEQFVSGETPSLKKVVVVLSLFPNYAYALLATLKRFFPDGGASAGLEFTLKPHPVYYHSKEELQKIFPAPIFTGTFDEVIKTHGTVLFQESTAGFEAWLMGRNTLHYRPDFLVDFNGCDYLDETRVPICSDHGLGEKILESMETFKNRNRDGGQQFCENQFGQVNSDLWKQLARQFIQ